MADLGCVMLGLCDSGIKGVWLLNWPTDWLGVVLGVYNGKNQPGYRGTACGILEGIKEGEGSTAAAAAVTVPCCLLPCHGLFLLLHARPPRLGANQ